MTMHKALYRTDDIDSLYVPRKEEGHANIEDDVDSLIQ